MIDFHVWDHNHSKRGLWLLDEQYLCSMVDKFGFANGIDLNNYTIMEFKCPTSAIDVDGFVQLLEGVNSHVIFLHCVENLRRSFSDSLECLHDNGAKIALFHFSSEDINFDKYWGYPMKIPVNAYLDHLSGNDVFLRELYQEII